MRTMAIRKLRLIRCFIVLPLLVAGVAFAQQQQQQWHPQSVSPTQSQPQSQTQSQPQLLPRVNAPKPGLQIQPGDLVNVHVYDTPEFEQNVRVSEAGDVQLILLGEVHIAGLTPAEAAQKVQDLLITTNVMLHPAVTMAVTTYETELVSVTGEVNKPGVQQITTPRSAIDLIALSGGLTDLADRNILIRRKGSPANQATFFFSNNPQDALRNDVTVYPGDTIIVPRVGIVYVLGDVGKPGGYPMDQPDSEMTALKAIALAGATNHTAVPSNARLIHKTVDGQVEETKLNFAAIQKGKAPDVVLDPGDVIYIPFSYVKNALTLGSSSVLSAVAGAAIYTH